MAKKALCIASNYGLWAEELQAPWDVMKSAGIDLTLATRTGKVPLPMKISMDPEMVDPLQDYKVNPVEVVDRVYRILKDGEWDNPIRIADAKAGDYDAIVVVGGPGAPLDLTGNPALHKLLLDAFKGGKIIGAICYAVGALVFTRDPDNRNRSVLFGKRVTAHPHAWDFDFDVSYELLNATPDNPGTDLVTPGFTYPLQYIVEDAVGSDGEVVADTAANRERPCFVYDHPFVSALSVESSIAFGETMLEALSG